MKRIPMIYPDFNTDILFSIENLPFTKENITEIISKNLDGSAITITVQENTNKKIGSNGGWIYNKSFINLYINDNFVEYHFKQSTNAFEAFIPILIVLIRKLVNIASPIVSINEGKRTRPFVVFSAFYKTHNNYKFQFLFELFDDENQYITAFMSLLNTIVLYKSKGVNELKKSVKQTYSQSNRIKYFLFINNKWVISNPLFEVCKEINEEYKESNDFRIMKPNIIINEDNYNKHFIHDEEWILVFDKLVTCMIKPNDVSLYSNISHKHLLEAQKFYNETIIPRHEHYNGTFPNTEQQKEYFDYFEMIITSLIFAYTSLEAFANICIPELYKYSEKKNGIETIYSKEAIELKFSLKDKLKKIIRKILNTPDPSQEKWWNTFSVLENLRNEIIHTKQSKSEEKYSKLLSKDIFEIISIHKKIIKYYGQYIFSNKKELLNEFPYGFEFDDFLPVLITDKYYESRLRDINNPTIKTKRKKSTTKNK